MYAIQKHRKGDYRCIVVIQDGIERWSETTEERAIEKVIQTAKIMNGADITRNDIRFEDVSDLKSSYADEKIDDKSFETTVNLIRKEYQQATKKFGTFASSHEGYAVIQEELDELWDGIKKNDSPVMLKKEAMQVAAMAIRFCVDL